MLPEKVVLKVHGWHTECGSCGYGKGGPFSADNPGRQGKPILGPDSTVCHGCAKTFTHKSVLYGEPLPITDAPAPHSSQEGRDAA